ncbi:MAG TPA: glycosyltransferase, partial [Rectinemataceae bacterium]|nr:glycosyltransferase [Rectinemataceae bacterium]
LGTVMFDLRPTRQYHQKSGSVSTGLFNDSYAPIMDGVTITVKNYALWLNKLLGPTEVVTPHMPNYEDNDPFPVIRFLSMSTIFRPPYRIGLPDLDFSLQYRLKNRDFDIVHAHSPFAAGLLAKKVAKERHIPIVATFHSKYRDDLKQTIAFKSIVDEQIKRVVDFYYSVDQVWIPQESAVPILREYGYKGPYEVMANGIDMKPPIDLAPTRKRGAEELGLSEGISVGLYVGQHTLEKNLELLVNSLPAIMAARPDFRMVFVGMGYAKPHLQQLVQGLGIEKNVIFHDVIYDRELLGSIYARADIFLFPSLYDTFSLVVREAAAFKTPSVLIKGAMAAEAIHDGQNGYLCENREEAFAAKVVEALGDQTNLKAVAKAAQTTLCRTWENVVTEVKERYVRILSRWEHKSIAHVQQIRNPMPVEERV